MTHAAANDKTAATITLFGLPYAGGNMWSYRPLESALPAGVKLVGIELPGRGRRGAEGLKTSAELLADDVFGQLRTRISGRYALYGHSMGALVGLLVIRRLMKASLPLPEVFFLSGCEAPSMRTPRRRHQLGPSEFVDMLQEMGGCPPEVLADAELLEFFEPIIRADFQAFETWSFSPAEPVTVPFAILRGKDDEVSEESARAWARETAGPCSYAEFSGGHFFILQHWRAIGAIIADHFDLPPRA